MVVHLVANQGTGVRFPLPAPICKIGARLARGGPLYINQENGYCLYTLKS